MFGDSLLVANVVEKGQTVRPVYLPKTENENERFYNFYTREEYAPGQTIEVPVDISSIPLFVRSGAILPMSGNRLHNLMTENDHCAGDPDGTGCGFRVCSVRG